MKKRTNIELRKSYRELQRENRDLKMEIKEAENATYQVMQSVDAIVKSIAHSYGEKVIEPDVDGAEELIGWNMTIDLPDASCKDRVKVEKREDKMFIAVFKAEAFKEEEAKDE